MELKREPSFRVDKESNPPRVFIRCSQCDKDIREMLPGESIRVTQAYYCEDCDPGVTVLNPPREKK